MRLFLIGGLVLSQFAVSVAVHSSPETAHLVEKASTWEASMIRAAETRVAETSMIRAAETITETIAGTTTTSDVDSSPDVEDFLLLSPPAQTETTSDPADSLVKLNRPYAMVGTVANPSALAWCEDKVARTLRVLPQAHVDAIHSLSLSFDPFIRRGLAGGNTLILRCVDVSAAELTAVLVHELGHIVDTGLLNSSGSDNETSFVDREEIVYSSDPSVTFYSASWTDNRSFKGQKQDFVSGYAMSSPFEDFAETYVMYVLQGSLFRDYATQSPLLRQKYEFMKTEVFGGMEFDLDSAPSPSELLSGERPYDVTRLDFSLESFWALREHDGSSPYNLKGYQAPAR